MRAPTIKTFYTPEMAPATFTGSYSKSPNKPTLFMQYMETLGRESVLSKTGDFAPFKDEDFLVAHTAQYVGKFFGGVEPQCSYNGVPWSEDFANSVRYTNSSLYHAIKHANAHPETVTFSPTSGFHHAKPTGGLGFSTFSGQVIASVKLYREQGLVGAYFDLDGHFGNSIEDSRTYVKDLNKAVPKGFNINPTSNDGTTYIKQFKAGLAKVKKAILEGIIHYVVFCHGADSHKWDDLHGQLSTEDWLHCSELFYWWAKDMDKLLGRPLPVTLSLFGGYRRSYDYVMELHAADVTRCAAILCENGVAHQPLISRYNDGDITYSDFRVGDITISDSDDE